MPRADDLALGPLAVALATGYGLTPDDWQADIVGCSLGRRKNGRYASATVGQAVPRQNGKNGWLEVRELFGMIAMGEKFLHTAHEVKTARKAFRRIASFFENERQYPELFSLVAEIRKTNGQEAILLTNGGGIEFIARSSGSGRGFTVDVLVCDEAQDLTDDELAALLPTISASPSGNPQVILTGTPPDPEKPDAAKGEVFRRVRADAKAESDPNLCFIDFGVPDGPLPDVDDRSLWYRVNPALGGRLNIAEVERERKLMSPEKFARERLGWWGDDSSTDLEPIFGEGAWEDCETEIESGKPAAVGLAVSIDRKFSAFGLADAVDDGLLLRSGRRETGTAWVVDEAVRLTRERDCELVVDGKGPAANLLPELEDAGVRVKVTSTSDYMSACSDLFDDVQVGTAIHRPDDEPLNRAVSVATIRPVGDRWAWGRRGEDISCLEAVTLAAWLARKGSDYDVTDSVY